MPGGVSSPVRAFRAVGGIPPVIERGHASRLVDVDGNEYIDYVGSWGPLILGHAHPAVVEAVAAAAASGLGFGATTEREIQLAELVTLLVPSIERVRFVSSGTEAVMSALRLARAVTGRPLVIKFDGAYHGHSDGLLVAAGSGPTTLGVPDSAGVPDALARLTVSIPYNDLSAVERALQANDSAVAAVIVEPVAGNMGVVPPQDGFLPGLHDLCKRHGALLVFDEVITGFRLSLGGAQERFGVLPDLTCLGKILGGGMPIGAYGGPLDLMRSVAPEGPVYQAGTLSGNPLAMAAGLATLGTLERERPYDRIGRLARDLEDGLSEAAAAAGLAVTSNRVGSMLSLFFADRPVTDYAGAKLANTDRYARYFHGMLNSGVALAPSQFETAFISTAHSDDDIRHTIQAARNVMADLVGG